MYISNQPTITRQSEPRSFNFSGGIFGGLIGGGLNLLSQHMANKTNIRLQQEANEWNERLMREAWDRDDNAVRRRVADLQAAGLHPSLAAGGGQSSSPIHVGSTSVDSVRAGDAAIHALEGAQYAAQIAHTQAQNKLLSEQTRSQQLENIVKSKKIELGTTEEELRALSHSTDIKIKQEERDSARHDFNLAADRYDLDIYKELNLPRGTPLGLIQKLETFLGFLSRLIEGRDQGLLSSAIDTSLDITGNAITKSMEATMKALHDLTGGSFPTIEQYEVLTEQWLDEIENGRIPNGFERMFLRDAIEERGITPQSQAIQRRGNQQ